MPRKKDTRDFSFSRRPENAVRAAAESFSDTLPGSTRVHAGRVNPITGTPTSLTAENAGVGPGTLVERALACVQDQFSEGLGFSSAEAPEYVPDPHVQQTTGGKSIVHLHQQYQGIPVFEMTRSVQFGRDKKVERVVGDNVSIDHPLVTVPQVTAIDALRIAARYLAENQDQPEEDAWGQTHTGASLTVPTDYVPRVVSVFERPSRPTVLDKGPFGKEVEASLVFFYDGQEMRLSWKLLVTMVDLIEQYVMLIAADRPVDPKSAAAVNEAVLLCQPTTSSVIGNVFLHNPGIGERQAVDFPRIANTYPVNATVPLPNPFPAAWWVDADRTIGNCAVTVQGTGTSTLGASVNNGEVRFDPAQPEGDEQQLLNAFFFCNYMHDFFFMLGFTEEAGNFQKVNFGGGGAASDAVLARVHNALVQGTATMGTPPDGQAPLMTLGIVNLPDGRVRHTALDSDVVFHEYVHGVTNRLVGGRMNTFALQQPQSRGMGEGWGDYFALTIQNHGRPAEKFVTGDWVTNRPGGIRSAPYDENYPNTYGDVGSGPFTGPHRIGEIWCATLMQMNRRLDGALGAPRGHQLGWQIVVDGLKLAPANPSFLDARDAILQALVDLEQAGRLSAADFPLARRAAWEAFSRFGMGANANTLGASLQGIQEDNTIPAGV
jgi:extracellular elastinolytic metalloproteinase